MQIGDRPINRDHPPYVIAEIGVNHDGRRETAIRLIDAATEAGASAVKFQVFTADLLVGQTAELATYQERSGATDAHAMLRALELSLDDCAQLIDHTHAGGLHAIVTVFNVELVEPCRNLPIDAYKTASPDIINRPLIEALIECGMPLILSTGASTASEVRDAVGWVGTHPAAVLQCVSAYPTPDEDAALGGIDVIAEIVDPRPVGYSDHTTSLDTGALAVASGALLLEKHLTLDRTATGPDHAASLEPNDLATYIRLAHRAWQMCGRREKCIRDIEHDVRRVARQSITAARDLVAGCTIDAADVVIRRPGTGLEPYRLHDVIGRVLGRDAAAGQPITSEHLA